MLINKVKQDQLNFRKQAIQDKSFQVHAKLLTTLIGESQKDGKDPSDDELKKVILKFIKNAQEMKRLKDTESINVELDLLNSYIPRKVDFNDLSVALSDLEFAKSNKGLAMKAAKEYCADHGLTFDGSVVNEFLNQ